MNYWHSITVLLGLILLFWGFWASFKARKPWDIIGSILSPIGLFTAILGALLMCVPHFFG
ncbi:MAG: hypothetical protein WBM02_00075 [bacterium]